MSLPGRHHIGMKIAHLVQYAALALNHSIFPDGLPGILLRIATSVPTAILFTWFYNRTTGNLWLVVLLHTATNNTAGFWLPVTVGVYVTMSIAAATYLLNKCFPVFQLNQVPARSQAARWPRRWSACAL
ncbi:MAG: hypothetical protein H7Z42_12790 [Roseiflexaceae bacterium]|nr:hypothetical protein [Roseiflexaceae bacterium]